MSLLRDRIDHWRGILQELRGDAHVLGRQHLRNGKLVWRPHKTLRSTAKQLAIPVVPELQAALDALPATDGLTFLVTDRGRPFASAAAFGNKFADWCKAAGLRPVQRSCDSVYRPKKLDAPDGLELVDAGELVGSGQRANRNSGLL